MNQNKSKIDNKGNIIMKKRLAYDYKFENLTGYDFRSKVREFLDNGATKFVIKSTLLKQMIEDKERIKFIRKVCNDMEVEFSSVHGLDGKFFDMNIPEPDQRKIMLESHKKAMAVASDFGCKTYTVHVGAHHYCNEKISLDILRPLALESLEKLLPIAEKLGIIIAVENSFEKPNSAKEVLGLVTPFLSSPAIGVCYDTGHAHCMESMPGRDMNKYECYFPICWYEEGVILEDNALDKLKEHVVTCHIHDNNGYGDYHAMPFDGNINWRELMPKLFSCPRMIDFQTEVEFGEGENWAGKLLSPPGGYSIRRLVDTFRILGLQS